MPAVEILVVDDQEYMRDLISEMLLAEFPEVRVTKCSNGFEALNAVKSNGRYEFLVTDLEMPIMDGAVLIGTLRQLGRTIPTVLLSGNHQHLKQVGESLGVPTLAKPFQMEDLTSMVAPHIPA